MQLFQKYTILVRPMLPIHRLGGQQRDHPGIAELVPRLLWECRGAIRDRAGRNAAKSCDTCVYGTFSDYRKRHKSGFDHINDHRQKKTLFLPLAVVSWQKSEYPGVAQLVGRDIWDVEVGCSSHLTRTKIPLKSTISEGFFLFFVYCGAGFDCNYIT